MKMLARAAVVLAAILFGAPASAATTAVPNCLYYPAVPSACQGVVQVDPSTGNPLATRETFALATANVASAVQTVNGGTYIFAQMATAYGTIALQVLGPDGATYETISSKTSSDTTGGTSVQLQAGAKVRVTLTGTTGAVATLGRVP